MLLLMRFNLRKKLLQCIDKRLEFFRTSPAHLAERLHSRAHWRKDPNWLQYNVEKAVKLVLCVSESKFFANLRAASKESKGWIFLWALLKHLIAVISRLLHWLGCSTPTFSDLALVGWPLVVVLCRLLLGCADVNVRPATWDSPTCTRLRGELSIWLSLLLGRLYRWTINCRLSLPYNRLLPLGFRLLNLRIWLALGLLTANFT